MHVNYFHSFCESVRVTLADGVVTSVTATFYPDLPSGTAYFIEAGGMQVNIIAQFNYENLLLSNKKSRNGVIIHMYFDEQ